MATLQQRLTEGFQRVRERFNAIRPKLLPTGGTTGQVLTKTGTADFAAGWSDPTGGGSGGGLTEAQASAIARRAAILYAVR